MSLTFLVVASLLSTPQESPSAWDTPITIEHRHIALPALVEEIGKIVGTKLILTSSLQTEILYLHAPNQTPRTILEQIALATDANWERVEGGVRLTRPALPNRWDEPASLARRKALIEKALAELPAYAPNDKLPTPDAEGMIYQDLPGGGRSGQNLGGYLWTRANNAVARLIGAETIARIPPGERWTFAPQPTRFQYKIPGSVERITRDLTSALPRDQSIAPIEEVKEATSAYITVLSEDDSIQVWLRPITDGRSSTAFSSTQSIQLPSETTSWPNNTPPEGIASEFAFTPESVEIISATIAQRLPDPKWIEAMGKPEGDWLTQPQVEIYRAAQAKFQKPFLALLGDPHISAWRELKNWSPKTLEKAWQVMLPHKLRLRERNGWMVAVPGDNFPMRTVPLPREPLKALLSIRPAVGEKRVKIPFSTYADAVMQVPYSLQNRFVSAHALLAGLTETQTNADLRAVRLYAALSAAQRTEISMNGEISLGIGSANPELRRTLERMFYFSEIGIQDKPEKPEDIRPPVGGRSSRGGQAGEPGFAFPNGIPASTEVTIRLGEYTSYVLQTQGGGRSWFGNTAEQFLAQVAAHRYALEIGVQTRDPLQNQTMISRPSNMMHVLFELPEKGLAQAAFVVPGLVGEDFQGTSNNLPEAHEKIVQSYMKKFRDKTLDYVRYLGGF